MIPRRIPKLPPIRISNNHRSLKVHETDLAMLVKQVLRAERIFAREVHVIFVDDSYMRRLHNEYLNDDSPTDVMSFDLSDDSYVEGEIYISLDSAKNQATEFGVSLDAEIGRLVIHGLLHLKGYNDSTASERKKMRNREDYHLNKYQRTILL